MSEKKPSSKKAKTPLQVYLSKKLPPFRRGDADCGAWVGAWVNQLVGREVLSFEPMTFGAIKRRHMEISVRDYAAELLEAAGLKRVDNPSSGDVVIYSHPDSFGGQAVGIFHDGKAITRGEGGKLHVTKDPEVLESWTI